MSDVPPQSPGWPPSGGGGYTPPPSGGGYPPPPPGGGGYPPPPPPPGGGYPAPPPPPGPGGGGYPPPGGYGAPYGGAYSPAPGTGSQWGPLAEWPQRALGLLIDGAIIVVGTIAVVIVALILGAISSTLGIIVYFLGYLAVLAVGIWFSIQVGQTGASPGMRVIGLRCVKEETGQPIGGGMGFVRHLAHIVDSLICYVGWLFPLWDAKKQTIADKLIGTVVVTAPKQPFSIPPPTASA